MEKVKIKSCFYVVAALMALIMAASQGCKYENEEEIFGSEEECDVTEISYQGDITPIVDQFCFSCHSTAEARGGVILDTYLTIKSWADESLYCAISHGDGCDNMPKNQPQLSECNILKIKTWIDEGALEN
jgi:hypothetical protein